LKGVFQGSHAEPAEAGRSAGPGLYRVWSDAKGETHLEAINIATKGRAAIPAISLNFSGVVTGLPGTTRWRGTQL
jgi:hypothetical protein